VEPALVRAMIGLAVMLAACGFTFGVGNRTMRHVAVLIFVCWAAAVLAEFALGPHIKILLAANLASGSGLLLIATMDGAAWLLVMISIEASLFLLHALTMALDRAPGRLEVVGNNVLVTLGLVVMVGAAAAHRLRNSPEQKISARKWIGVLHRGNRFSKRNH
jgi:hypothetical protein